MSRSLFLLFCFVVVAGLVTYVNLSIAPTLPPELLKPPTPTPNIFATPLSSPTPSGGLATPTILLAPTVTLAPNRPAAPAEALPSGQVATDLPGAETAQPTATVAAAPTAPSNTCPPDANITSPPAGAIVSAVVTFFGTASADSFGRYTLEVNGPRTSGAWVALPVEDAQQQVFDSILGSVDVSTWQSGAHSFRLSVYDPNDAIVGQCQIQLSVETGNS